MSEILRNPEQELFQPHASTLTKDQLLERIYQNKSQVQDDRFLPVEDGGVFQHFFVTDLVREPVLAMMARRPEQTTYFPVVEVNHKIVALAKLASSTHEGKENVYWVSFVNVDPKFQGQKYGSKLAEEIFRFAKEKGISLENSSYTDEGSLKLKKKMGELAKEYSVPFKEKSDLW